jgi:two-component system LytT family sensor kinase
MIKYKWQLVFWICYFWYGFLTDKINDPETHIFSAILFFTTHCVFLFYSFLFVFKYRTFRKSNIFKTILLFLSVIVTFILIRYWVRFHAITFLGIPEPASLDLKVHFINGVLWIVSYFFYAAGYFYFQSSIQKQKDLLKSQEEKLTKEKEKIALEKENIQLENTALRAQITPHFLYNTLDFLYAKALPVSDELSDGVMKLSDIMRYSLKPQDAEGLVYLADEAEHIQNIIEMNQLRFDNKLNVDFATGNIPDNVKIMPLLLITMVENVFKHGTTNSPEFPARIALRVDEEDELHFSTHNKKRVGPKEHSTGIGLNNTLKRLKNTYGERCDISVTDKPDEFKVEINIQLLRNENNYLA